MEEHGQASFDPSGPGWLASSSHSEAAGDNLTEPMRFNAGKPPQLKSQLAPNKQRTNQGASNEGRSRRRRRRWWWYAVSYGTTLIPVNRLRSAMSPVPLCHATRTGVSPSLAINMNCLLTLHHATFLHLLGPSEPHSLLYSRSLAFGTKSSSSSPSLLSILPQFLLWVEEVFLNL